MEKAKLMTIALICASFLVNAQLSGAAESIVIKDTGDINLAGDNIVINGSSISMTGSIKLLGLNHYSGIELNETYQAKQTVFYMGGYP